MTRSDTTIERFAEITRQVLLDNGINLTDNCIDLIYTLIKQGKDVFQIATIVTHHQDLQ